MAIDHSDHLSQVWNVLLSQVLSMAASSSPSSLEKATTEVAMAERKIRPASFSRPEQTGEIKQVGWLVGGIDC